MHLVLNFFVALGILFFPAFSAYAKSGSHPFLVNQVTDRIYTAHPSGPISKINSTSTIIVGDTYLTVVESQPDQSLAEELLITIRKRISRLPIRYLIFTHYHLDHILGAAAFQRENPAIIIVAHKNVATYIRQDAARDKKQWADFLKLRAAQTFEDAKTQIDPKRKLFLEQEGRALTSFYDDVTASPLISPALEFTDSLIIRDSSLTLKLIHLGTGHTASDIIIHIPEQKTVITGDLVHDFEPLFGNANPDNWILILQKLQTIDCEHLIGGHGDAQNNKDVLNHWLSYLMELKEKTMEAIKQGLSLKDFQQSITERSFSALVSDSFGQRIQQHRTEFMTDRFIGSLDEAIRGELESLWGYYGGKSK